MSGHRQGTRWNSCRVAGALFAVLLMSGCRESGRAETRNSSGADSQKEVRTEQAPPVSKLADYDRLLHACVTEDGWVNYAALSLERSVLDGFLAELGSASPQNFKDDRERLAFWINAYNAFTLADALDSVYGQRRGVREVSGFFDKRKHLVAGEQLTLDEIETRGRKLHDPRIHFAIVCASTSCPKLRRFAYRNELLNEQLDQAAHEFFADANRGLRFDSGKNELHVSPILKWYAGDFTGSSAGTWARVKATVSGSELLDFIARYAPAAVAARIREHPPTLHYFDYDWSLNSLDTHATGSKP